MKKALFPSRCYRPLVAAGLMPVGSHRSAAGSESTRAATLFARIPNTLSHGP
jgi:hypothetical protein